MARTTKLYRIEADGRRLSAGAIRASSPEHLDTQWRLVLATAAQGIYAACYRGVCLSTALVPESGEAVRIGE